MTSAPVVSKQKRKKEHGGTQPILFGEMAGGMERLFRDDMQLLTQGVSFVPKPEGMIPVVTVSDKALPIAIAPLCLEAGDPTGVSLGIIAVAHYERGRVMCVGDINFFSACCTDPEGVVFLENSVRWAAAGVRGMIRVCLLGLSAEMSQVLQKVLATFGFHVSLRTNCMDVQRFNVVICASDCEFGVELRDAMKHGLSVLCGAADPESGNRYQMNSLLVETGIGFPQCFLVVGPLNAVMTGLSTSYSSMSRITLKSQAEVFEEMVKLPDEEIDLGQLDNVISTLRYHIGVMFQEHNEILERLADATLGALEASNCYNNGVFCSTLLQAVYATLFMDIMMKLPAAWFQGKDHSMIFPGDLAPQERITTTIVLPYKNDGWFTTGFYCPPGEVSNVAITGDVTGTMAIQIGSHTEVLGNKESEWTRWPAVTNVYRVGNEEVEIGSMFGGIVYLLNDDKCEGSVQMTFHDMCRYPVWQNGSWNDTEEFVAPFFEIATQNVIFTMPYESMITIPNIDEFVARIDEMIGAVLEFTSDVPDKPFRVVFDVELPADGPVCGYPIVMNYDMIEGIISPDQPSPALMILLIYIGILSLPAEYFDEDIESSLAITAAAAVFLRYWPNESPLDFVTIPLPSMFSDIWAVYGDEHDKTLLTKAMHRVRVKGQTMSEHEHMWTVFVQELKKLADGKDFQHLLPKKAEKVLPAEALIMSMSSSNLQSYQLSDEEIHRLK